ncbi:MAG: hypothetical protein ABSE19_06785 [Candidatus Acidiferrum sp.]|jgi:hypothetical protein
MASKARFAKSATEGLKVLWEDKYFRTWKKMDAIVGEFAKRDNHFSDAELGMALKRANYLVRRGKRRSYEYIQKYPFVPKGDGEAPAAKKRGKK